MQDERTTLSSLGRGNEGMSSSASMSVEHFRRDLEVAIRDICNERAWRFDNEAERGWAFQFWIADLFRDRDQGIDTGITCRRRARRLTGSGLPV